MEFEKQLKAYINKVNAELDSVFGERECLQKVVYDAMAYSVKAGGKRLRPVLSLAVCDMLGGCMDDALRFGVAIEHIHTYSLIHDDLPCMDNDDLRRGMPTCHKKFGEANALLAGDGLLTGAFEYLADLDKYKEASAATVISVISEIAKAAGCEGMIGGQVVDLECEGKADVDMATLNYLHQRKTGALIRASAVCGAMAAGASTQDVATIGEFAQKLGIAFQIQDDILDCIGEESLLGKPIGSDAENEKSTYVTLLGIDAAKKKAEDITNEALGLLEKYGEKAEFVKKLALYLLDRKS